MSIRIDTFATPFGPGLGDLLGLKRLDRRFMGRIVELRFDRGFMERVVVLNTTDS